jgi:hypothetical protein
VPGFILFKKQEFLFFIKKKSGEEDDIGGINFLREENAVQ